MTRIGARGTERPRSTWCRVAGAGSGSGAGRLKTGARGALPKCAQSANEPGQHCGGRSRARARERARVTTANFGCGIRFGVGIGPGIAIGSGAYRGRRGANLRDVPLGQLRWVPGSISSSFGATERGEGPAVCRFAVDSKVRKSRTWHRIRRDRRGVYRRPAKLGGRVPGSGSASEPGADSGSGSASGPGAGSESGSGSGPDSGSVASRLSRAGTRPAPTAGTSRSAC